jgi:hypothetical protein
MLTAMTTGWTGSSEQPLVSRRTLISFAPLFAIAAAVRPARDAGVVPQPGGSTRPGRSCCRGHAR